MSYVQSKRPRRARAAMGEWTCPPMVPAYLCQGQVTQTSNAQDCVNRANASTQVSSIDQQIATLSTSWKPTGYYTPAEVQSLLDVLANEAAAVGTALADARKIYGAEDAVAQAFDDLVRKYQTRAATYKDAVAKSRAAGGSAIDAPGLKDWVLASMQAISDGYVVATVMSCMETPLETLLNRAYRGIVAIGAVAWKVVGVAIKAGQTVVKAAEGAGDLIAAAIKYGPFAALGIAAFILYTKRH